MTSLDIPTAPAARDVTVGALFTGFLFVGLRGFGGVLPWAYRMIVEERKWLDSAEYTNMLSVCQLLPGPNIVNFTVALGKRFKGLPGAIAAFSGLMLAPLVIVLILGELYERYGSLPHLELMFRDLGCAAAGLVVATSWKLGRAHRGKPLSILVALIAFVAVVFLHWPLILVVLGLAPLSVLMHWRFGR